MKKIATILLCLLSLSAYSQKKSNKSQWISYGEQWTYKNDKVDTIIKTLVNTSAGKKYFNKQNKDYIKGIQFTWYDGKELKTSVCDSLFTYSSWECSKTYQKKAFYLNGVKVKETKPYWDNSGVCISNDNLVISYGFTGDKTKPYYYGSRKEPIKVVSIQMKTIIKN